MFCGCLNDPDEIHPNINICPICTGQPGTLPVINIEAVKKVLMVGKALNGRLAEYSQFDRKNYFYPDLPKGYQISQYQHPLVEGGDLLGIKIRRIHLEEDTGSLVHKHNKSLINYNRAGVPLMELVTEPVITFGKEARKFAEELQLILRYLNVSDADMEKGQMRVEVNISLSKDTEQKNDGENFTEAKLFAPKLGTKVEIKNLNSFRAVEGAIDYEIERQKNLLNRGEKVVQETRGWDEDKGITFSQRKKEESHDYRYFPEPDLPPLNILDLGLKDLKLPELPEEKRIRFKEEYEIRPEYIEIIISNKKLADFFEAAVSELEDKKATNLLANYIISDLFGLFKEKLINIEEIDNILIKPSNLAQLINMIDSNEINSRMAKDILKIMLETGKNPKMISEEKGLIQISDESAVNEIIEEIIKENQKAIDDYKNGKESAMQFLIGQAMKKTKGSVNLDVLKRKFKEKIS